MMHAMRRSSSGWGGGPRSDSQWGFASMRSWSNDSSGNNWYPRQPSIQTTSKAPPMMKPAQPDVGESKGSLHFENLIDELRQSHSAEVLELLTQNSKFRQEISQLREERDAALAASSGIGGGSPNPMEPSSSHMEPSSPRPKQMPLGVQPKSGRGSKRGLGSSPTPKATSKAASPLQDSLAAPPPLKKRRINGKQAPPAWYIQLYGPGGPSAATAAAPLGARSLPASPATSSTAPAASKSGGAGLRAKSMPKAPSSLVMPEASDDIGAVDSLPASTGALADGDDQPTALVMVSKSKAKASAPPGAMIPGVAPKSKSMASSFMGAMPKRMAAPSFDSQVSTQEPLDMPEEENPEDADAPKDHGFEEILMRIGNAHFDEMAALQESVAEASRTALAFKTKIATLARIADTAGLKEGAEEDDDVWVDPNSTADTWNRKRDKARVEGELGVCEWGDHTTRFADPKDPSVVVGRGYQRVLYGDHGPYIEFHATQVNWQAFKTVKRKCDMAYYDEHYTPSGAVKAYEQRKTVRRKPNPPPGRWSARNNRPEGYADYQPGCVYMACDALQVLRVTHACIEDSGPVPGTEPLPMTPGGPNMMPLTVDGRAPNGVDRPLNLRLKPSSYDEPEQLDGLDGFDDMEGVELQEGGIGSPMPLSVESPTLQPNGAGESTDLLARALLEAEQEADMEMQRAVDGQILKAPEVPRSMDPQAAFMEEADKEALEAVIRSFAAADLPVDLPAQVRSLDWDSFWQPRLDGCTYDTFIGSHSEEFMMLPCPSPYKYIVLPRYNVAQGRGFTDEFWQQRVEFCQKQGSRRQKETWERVEQILRKFAQAGGFLTPAVANEPVEQPVAETTATAATPVAEPGGSSSSTATPESSSLAPAADALSANTAAPAPAEPAPDAEKPGKPAADVEMKDAAGHAAPVDSPAAAVAADDKAPGTEPEVSNGTVLGIASVAVEARPDSAPAEADAPKTPTEKEKTGDKNGDAASAEKIAGQAPTDTTPQKLPAAASSDLKEALASAAPVAPPSATTPTKDGGSEGAVGEKDAVAPASASQSSGVPAPLAPSSKAPPAKSSAFLPAASKSAAPLPASSKAMPTSVKAPGVPAPMPAASKAMPASSKAVPLMPTAKAPMAPPAPAMPPLSDDEEAVPLKPKALQNGSVCRKEFDADMGDASEETGAKITIDAENDRLILRGKREQRDNLKEMLKEVLDFYKIALS